MSALEWTNLSVQVPDWTGMRLEKKTILRQLSGRFRTGTLNGLLGPSGAGKTTLLKVLSGSDTTGLTGGSSLYSPEESPPSYFIAQHVHQSIVGELTIGQILRYAYSFKNGSGTSSGEIDKFIDQTLDCLLLDQSILDRPFARCSGGEQKRVAIAQELMSRQAPAFLFLDEPTTGLDSAAAYEVMSSLSSLSRAQSITIIASIHAPNHETLCLFDQLYVLAKGGVAIFSGPPKAIRSWLEETLSLPIPPSQPPIEALIKLACSGRQSPSVLQLAASQLAHQWTLPPSKLTFLPSGLVNRPKAFSMSDFYLALCRLSRITFIAKRRFLLLTFAIFTLYIGLLSTVFSSSMTSSSGCTPFNQTSPTVNAEACLATVEVFNNLRENGFYLCNILLYTGVVTICSSAAFFAANMAVFRSEHRNGWYSWAVFYAATLLVSLLQVSLYALLNGVLAYFTSGQHSIDGYSVHWYRLASYIFFLWLLTLYTASIGQLIGLLLVDHPQLAVFLSLVYYIAVTLVNGFFVDTEARESWILQQGSSLLAQKFISWGMLYTFYGIDRCNWATEFSMVFQTFHIDQKAIGGYILRVLVNILLVRLVTVGVMFAKFKQTTKARRRKNCTLIKEANLEETLKKLKFHGKLEEKQIQIESETAIQSMEADLQMIKKRNQLFGKILLAWENLSLFAGSSVFENGIQREANVRPILRQLNGQVRFGTLNALMGTSGAGKTSLLNVLNGRGKRRLSEETVWRLSGVSQIQTCFIAQEVSGHLMPGLTAKQSLIYASRLRNPQAGVDHQGIALRWLQELDLLHTASTKVEKCSGGEQKRLAVALELTGLSMPNCVCIDEPTSGLDTNSAERVISVLHTLTRNHPMAIITSIHQPTSTILGQFDQLYVLARGGVAIYSGPPSGIQAHLHSLPQSTLSSSQYPIETLIKISCSAYPSQTVHHLVDLTKKQASLASPEGRPTPDGIPRNRTRFTLSSLSTLLSRHLLTFRQRLWSEHLFFSLNYLFYGLFIPLFYDPSMVSLTGCIDLQGDLNPFCSSNQTALRGTYQLLDNFKYTFFANNFFAAFILLQLSLSFLREMVFFTNEHRNGAYSCLAFYLAKCLSDLLPLLPTVLLYVAIIGHWYESHRPGIYLSFLLLFLLATLATQGLAHLLALLSRGSITLLIFQAMSVILFTILLSNFLLLYGRLHYAYQLLSNLAIGRFFFEAVILLQYGFGRCAPGEIQVTLYSMGLSDADYGTCLGMLLLLVCLYHGLAIWLLIWQANPRDNGRQRVARIETFRKNLKPAATWF